MESEVPEENQLALVAFVTSLVAIAALLLTFWLIVPAVVFGLIALTLGLKARRRAVAGAGRRDMAMAAIVLGLVAMLGTPWSAWVSAAGEDWGRSCAIDPVPDPNC